MDLIELEIEREGERGERVVLSYRELGGDGRGSLVISSKGVRSVIALLEQVARDGCARSIIARGRML